MKKIALITWYNSINFGTCIQCVALSTFLRNNGYDVCVPENYSYYTLKDPADFIRRAVRKVKIKLHPLYQSVDINELPENIRAGYEKRAENVKHVIATELNIYPIRNNGSFKLLNKDTDAFITGSDQIWNPNHISSVMLLSFVANGKRMLAYASSIGVSEIPPKLRPFYKKYLSRFSAIGVREESAVKALNEVNIGVPITQVLDPTLLLTKEDLIQLGQKADMCGRSFERQFIFCYFIGGKMDWTEDVKRFAADNNLDIVICLSESNVVPDFGTIVADAGPYEFLWLIQNASYIATDSFHASAISLNLQKQFFVYKRFEDDDSNSQNSRLYDLLKAFGLTNRLISTSNPIEHSATNVIDYTSVTSTLEKLRVLSKDFLIGAIEGDSYGDMQ